MDKSSTLKSIMRSSKKDRSTDPYKDYKKSPVTKIYHRITSNSLVSYQWKKALIVGGIIILVAAIITTIGTSMFYYRACNCMMCNLLLLGKSHFYWKEVFANKFLLFISQTFYIKIIFVLKNKVHIK